MQRGIVRNVRKWLIVRLLKGKALLGIEKIYSNNLIVNRIKSTHEVVTNYNIDALSLKTRYESVLFFFWKSA